MHKFAVTLCSLGATCNENMLRFDPDLWCFRGRVFEFPACSFGHSGSARTFAQTKDQDCQVPFLPVLGASRKEAYCTNARRKVGLGPITSVSERIVLGERLVKNRHITH